MFVDELVQRDRFGGKIHDFGIFLAVVFIPQKTYFFVKFADVKNCHFLFVLVEQSNFEWLAAIDVCFGDCQVLQPPDFGGKNDITHQDDIFAEISLHELPELLQIGCVIELDANQVCPFDVLLRELIGRQPDKSGQPFENPVHVFKISHRFPILEGERCLDYFFRGEEERKYFYFAVLSDGFKPTIRFIFFSLLFFHYLFVLNHWSSIITLFLIWLFNQVTQYKMKDRWKTSFQLWSMASCRFPNHCFQLVIPSVFCDVWVYIINRNHA